VSLTASKDLEAKESPS